MKKTIKSFKLTITFLLLLQTYCHGQYIPISIDQKIENSEHIVEGRVIAQQSYIGSDDEIYTENVIAVTKEFKGTLSNSEISIITRGGQVGEKQTWWTHMLSLDINEYGTFFLIKSKLPKRDNSSFLAFDTYSGSQGFYHYRKNEFHYKAHTVLDDYKNVTEFYSRLNIDNSLRTLEFIKFDTVNKDSCIIYKIEPVILNSLSSGTSVQLRILVRNIGGEFRLNQGQLFLNYSTEWFYENMVSNGHLTFSDGDFSSNYSLSIDDYTSNTLNINLEATTSNYSDLEVINSDFKLVGTVNVTIKSISDENPIEEDFNISNYSNTHRTSDGYVREFDCVKVEHGANCGMSITSITPLAAAGVGLQSENGITGVIEIIGENFLDDEPEFACDKPIDHHVRFNTIDDSWIIPFDGDYLEYTDTKIRVKVPTVGIKPDCETPYTTSDLNDAVACTGEIQVCRPHWLWGNCCGCSTTSSDKLYVPFAARNTSQTNSGECVESVRMLLRNINGTGGYTIRFQQNFKDISGAVDAYKRAVSTWRCATQVHFDVDEVGPPVGTPGSCIVRMASLGAGVRAGTAFNFENCGTEPNVEFSASHEGFLMTFNSDIDWHTGTSMPSLNWNNPSMGTLEADLESTGLHELGHSHLLLHTCNTDNVMFRPGPGQSSTDEYRRDLTIDDENGGDHISILSSNQTASACDGSKMILVGLSDCDITSVVEIGGTEYEFLVFPNPASSSVLIKLKENFQDLGGHISIYNGQGLLVGHNHLRRGELEFNINTFPSGIYYVEYISENNNSFFISKFIKE